MLILFSPLIALLVVASIFLGIVSFRVKEERLLLIPHVGIQTTTVYTFHSTSHFVDSSLLKDLIIHEAISGWSIISFMAFIVSGEEKSGKRGRMHVVFPKLKPRRDVLVNVYKGVRAVVYGDE